MQLDRLKPNILFLGLRIVYTFACIVGNYYVGALIHALNLHILIYRKHSLCHISAGDLHSQFWAFSLFQCIIFRHQGIFRRCVDLKLLILRVLYFFMWDHQFLPWTLLQCHDIKEVYSFIHNLSKMKTDFCCFPILLSWPYFRTLIKRYIVKLLIRFLQYIWKLCQEIQREMYAFPSWLFLV